MARRDAAEVLEQRGREREIAGRHADAGGARRGVDLGEVLVEEAGRADHDRHSPLQRERHVMADQRRMRVVDEHVRATVERLLDVGLDGDAEALAAQRLADVAAESRGAPPPTAASGRRRRDGRHEPAPDGAERARDADGEGCSCDGTSRLPQYRERAARRRPSPAC